MMTILMPGFDYDSNLSVAKKPKLGPSSRFGCEFIEIWDKCGHCKDNVRGLNRVSGFKHGLALVQ